MKEYLAILDTDRAYADGLAKSLNRDEHFPFYAACFADKEALLGFLREHPVAVLLLPQELEDEDLKHLDVRQTLYLTDVRGYTAVDSVPAVFRYQPVYRLKEELMRLQTCITDAGAPDEQAVFRTSFIGVQSPAGRTGKTGFALVLGILLAQTSKVLYMNLEPFSGLEAWFGESAEGGRSDLLFSMEVRGKDFPLEGCMREFHGLSWIPPARMAEDILKSEPGKVRDAVLEAAKRENFDVVILDPGTDYRMTEVFLPLLQKLYVPVARTGAQDEKTERFLRWTERVRVDAARITEKLTLPVIRTFTTGKGYLEQLIWSEMGDYVRSLLGEKV